VLVRPERSSDVPAIRRVHEQAFGRAAEADLVDGLRGDAAWLPALSLVAEAGDELLGHILFSRVFVVGAGRRSPGLSLAPMAVSSGEGFVVVLGHPDYYPRFGFTPAGLLGVARVVEYPPPFADLS
jgi:predicted N-acetyltransferase YhbS